MKNKASKLNLLSSLMGNSGLRILCLALSVTMFVGSEISVRCQGAPDVVWMSGGHGSAISAVAYSPVGDYVATLELNPGKIKIWRTSDRRLVRTINSVSTNSFNSLVAFAHPVPGELLVMAQEFDGVSGWIIRVWRVSDGALLNSIGPVSGGPLQVTADGLQILTSTPPAPSEVPRLRFYGIDGSEIRTLPPGPTYIDSTGQQVVLCNGVANSSAVMSADGTRIAFNCSFAYGGVMDATTGSLIGFKTVHPNFATAFASISGDGTLVTEFLSLYQVSNLSTSTASFDGHVPYISPDGTKVAGTRSSFPTGIAMFRSDGSLISSYPGAAAQSRPVFSGDSQKVAFDFGGQYLRLFNTSSGSPIGQVGEHHRRAVRSVAFSADGSVFASIGRGHYQSGGSESEFAIRIWDQSTGNLINEIVTNSSTPDSTQMLAISPEGQLIYNLSGFNSIQVRDTATGTIQRTINTIDTRGFAISPDGQTLASVNANLSTAGVDLFRTADGSLIRSIPGITGFVTFSSDGQSILRIGSSGNVSSHNVSTGGLNYSVSTGCSTLRAIAVSPDGQYFANAGQPFGSCPNIQIRSAATGSLVRSLAVHPGSVEAAVFTPDGNYLISGGTEKAIRFWAVADGSLARLYDQELPGGNLNVHTLAVSPTTDLFAYGREDSTLVTALNPFGSTPTGNTPAGSEVSVQPTDTTTGNISPVTLIFETVTAAGNTSVASSNAGPPPPTGFRLGSPPKYYDVSTTAIFTGTVTVCIDYSAATYRNDANLKLWHFNNTDSWDNVTISLDTTTKTICGQTTSLSPFVVLEQDMPPDFTAPESMEVTATSSSGVTVLYSVPTATDDFDGTVPVTCAPESGSNFGLGTTEVTCTATDSVGNTASRQFGVIVTYSWSGILNPINVDGSSVFRLGSTVPVKFRLIGASSGITDAVPRLYVSKIADGVAGTELEAGSTASASSGNLFRYDQSSGEYIFNWGTRGIASGTGTYQLRIDLADGVYRAVTLSLKK